MTPTAFIDQLDEARILAAIADAERKSSGEIRVYISHRSIKDALARARSRFIELGIQNTRCRNGVLIYLAPRTQQFAIVGDVGVHEKCGDSFWQELTAQMRTRLKEGQFTEAVVQVVGMIGDLLARHFPRNPDDQNELPDRIARD
jgi:uncharacterized membrane protein